MDEQQPTGKYAHLCQYCNDAFIDEHSVDFMGCKCFDGDLEAEHYQAILRVTASPFGVLKPTDGWSQELSAALELLGIVLIIGLFLYALSMLPDSPIK